MSGQSGKWMILVVTLWIQAFTGTNFDFSAYSSALKSVLGISQVQLNYLAVASDMGKVLGWSSGLALLYFPVESVMFVAAFMGFVGYGLQWLVICEFISLPYIFVFLLCLLSGCSICWFNTVCFVLCIRNFPLNRPLALALTVAFNGLSAALYTLIANSIDPSSTTLYLLLNASIPILASTVAIIPILRQPSLNPKPQDESHRDSRIFLVLNIIAVLTGIYLLLLGSHSSGVTSARVLLTGALTLLALPLFIPGVIYAQAWFREKIYASFKIDGSGFVLVDECDLELHKQLIGRETSRNDENGLTGVKSVNDGDGVAGTDRLVVLGEEHSAKLLVKRVDFWLYYMVYFCGGTIGLVYSNNLGQISQSLGQGADTTTLITLYSAFSFFGRLLSAAPDYVREKVYFARTGWLALALIPTPAAFFLLAASGSGTTLHMSTALIGLSSGFIFSAAVSITSELFGPNSVGVNHNILITNIPLGSLLYGLMAALVYDGNTSSGVTRFFRIGVSDTTACLGSHCYFLTFVVWGCISVIGLASSLLLFLRTKPTYDEFERTRSLR